MKLRHAAALALTGWYLMVPPLLMPPPSKHPVPIEADAGAPIASWQISQSFDRAEDCEKARTAMTKRVADPSFPIVLPANMGKNEVAASRLAIRIQAMSATCIATDDPYLRGK